MLAANWIFFFLGSLTGKIGRNFYRSVCILHLPMDLRPGKPQDRGEVLSVL